MNTRFGPIYKSEVPLHVRSISAPGSKAALTRLGRIRCVTHLELKHNPTAVRVIVEIVSHARHGLNIAWVNPPGEKDKVTIWNRKWTMSSIPEPRLLKSPPIFGVC